jgi:hypothetical protein
MAKSRKVREAKAEYVARKSSANGERVRRQSSVMRQKSKTAKQQPLHLSRAETELLQKINLGLSEQQWRRYRELIAKRRAETLAAEEQRELIALSDQIEQANARRMENLIALAKLRQVSLETQMNELGIKPYAYV